MGTSRVLEPLGGEDIVRLMCGVDVFVYGNKGLRCEFTTSSGDLVVMHYHPHDELFRKPVWSLRTCGHAHTCITHPSLVKTYFELYTGHVLDFL